MAKSWGIIGLYLISGEESRLGRKDYWNHVFLTGIADLSSKLLEILKVLFVIVFSVCMVAALARL
mgnify:CR=1 FL=1